MDITYLGGPTFLLRGRDAVLVTDPTARVSEARTTGRSAASAPDVITVSGPAGTPAELPDSTQTRTITKPGDYEASGIHIKGLRTSGPGTRQERSIAYLITIDGVVLCHLGHLMQALTAAEIGELGRADVVFVPIAGEGTLSNSAASEVVSALTPKYVIPMAYPLTPAGQQMQFDAASNDDESARFTAFLREMGIGEPASMPRLAVTPTSLPAEMTVVILQTR